MCEPTVPLGWLVRPHNDEDSGERLPVMSSTGIVSAAKAASGVGSPNSASFQASMLTMDAVIASRLRSGMRSNDAPPIQKSMKRRDAPTASPAFTSAIAASAAFRIPST